MVMITAASRNINNFSSCIGQSLQISPSSSRSPVRFVSGSRAVIQCFLDNNDLGNNGVFSWSGLALTSQERHTSTSLDSSGTLSTLTIYNVAPGDAGEYSCSYAEAQVFTTLNVIGKS